MTICFSLLIRDFWFTVSIYFEWTQGSQINILLEILPENFSNNESLRLLRYIIESSVNFHELEQYAKQHTRFSAPADSEPDIYEQYVQALHERGYTEDDAFFDDYMYQVETARDRAERFLKKRPLTTAIKALRDYIRRKYFQYDERKSDYVIYTSDVVLLVVMLSSLCGNHDCREHAQFYFIYNPILQ